MLFRLAEKIVNHAPCKIQVLPDGFKVYFKYRAIISFMAFQLKGFEIISDFLNRGRKSIDHIIVAPTENGIVIQRSINLHPRAVAALSATITHKHVRRISGEAMKQRIIDGTLRTSQITLGRLSLLILQEAFRGAQQFRRVHLTTRVESQTRR